MSQALAEHDEYHTGVRAFLHDRLRLLPTRSAPTLDLATPSGESRTKCSTPGSIATSSVVSMHDLNALGTEAVDTEPLVPP